MDSFQFLGGVGQFSLPSRYFKLSVIQYTSGTITATINLRNRPVSQAVDNLALALDETNDVRLSIRNADILKDSRNAQVISDAPNMIFGELSSTTAAASQLIMDTTGYQSISVEVAGTFSATFGFWASNDGANWTAVAGYPSAGSGTPISTNGAVGMYIVPAIGKYFKINLTAYTSGTVLCNCYLRSSPMPFLTNTTFVNTSQIGATAVVTAGVAGMQAVGGNIAAGVAPTANPILTAGIDTTGLTRRLYTDTTGRLIPVALDNTNTYRTIGVLPPASNPQNIGPTPVYITDTFEGQSLIELIGQLLLEMRITNQYLYELPRMLNASISIQDEPAAMRADATLFAQ